ncbi:MAG TPA: carboxymuconolactone decarboxylase family protein [Solirubrobacteraceae bacterium]|jgi:alkylhydroperoxidase family enzyme|nr:carboxymuconolactone decarboxylase family protein [Solirubrobacteraceae bacterium]
MTATPRISPGTRAEIGTINALIAQALRLAGGTRRPPNLFTTLARHRRLFRPWLRFAGALMPGGKLPRVDSELVILRVAHNCRSEYEWRHHERLGPAAGLTEEQVQAIGTDYAAGSPLLTERQRLLLGAADELHDARELSDRLWAQLSAELSEVELIELCMLVGHYEMLAMTLNSLRVAPDEFGARGVPKIVRLASRR